MTSELASNSRRLQTGGMIDRAMPLSFRFDGKQFGGYIGDTLASALLGNGVRVVGRSFKYHRPRGIFSAGPEEPNGLVELRSGARREPNIAMTTIELYDQLDAESQNRWPTLAHDLMSINSFLSSFLVAGFYYKTFMWPRRFWEKLYEPLIRRAAGLGRASGLPDPDRYEKATVFCDVLVIGAGPAGLMAALQAARAGARVILCHDDFALGGCALGEHGVIDRVPPSAWVAQVHAELAAMPDAHVMPRTTVFGAYDSGVYGALERVCDHLPIPPADLPRQRFWSIVARRCILATGAIERPMLFPGNDRPGVMLAASVRTYINRFAVMPGKCAVLLTNDADAARTVLDLATAGARIEAVIDPEGVTNPDLRQAVQAAGIEILTGASVTGTKGGSNGLSAVKIETFNGKTATIACDLLAVSGGWTPTLHLTCHLGGRPTWNEARCMFLPGALPPGMSVAGAAAGRKTLADCLADGAGAGVSAATDCGFAGAVLSLPRTEPDDNITDDPKPRTAALRGWAQKSSGKTFVDLQNDVTANDIALSAREGYSAIEHMKRYTTLGMATDQGKTSNVNGLALMADITGRSIPETGTTVFRPPYTPVAIGALAGPHRGKEFRPTRLAPTHDWAEESGATFVEAGMWLRAQYFPRAGETNWLQTVNREVASVRAGVGVCDVSTLGKIDVQGSDAAEFLERIYVNGWKGLRIGRTRYGLMLREDGFVMDDGTAARLAEDRFIVTTTTANAANVLRHMELCHQWLWPELDVQMISVTEQWAQISMAGPHARAVLERVVDPCFDVGNAAFPYMAAGEVTYCGGIPGRLFRLSFSGELAYEIAVPAGYGDSIMRRLIEVGTPFNITPYGTEALGVMRIEKGHPAGPELNGRTTAQDLGMGNLLSTKKDFIGRIMASRAALTDKSRPTLVGLRALDARGGFDAGASLLPTGKPATAAHVEGHVSSSALSPTLGRSIGLGFLTYGPERLGEIMHAVDPIRGRDTRVEVVAPSFYDPKGERLRV